jgi:protein gp37
MGESTSIAWTDATFNPWWGCERVSPGCAHCYADTFARRIGMSDLWQKRGQHGFRFFGDKHWAEPEKWARTLPAKLGRRPRVFCASMADVFEDRPELDEHRARLFDLIERTPELDWQILTKRPEKACTTLRLRWPAEIPRNVWIGTSIENTRWAYRADVLREIPAAVRFISAEPLLGPLSVKCGRCAGSGRDGELYCPECGGTGTLPINLRGIDWVIIGGESGPRARPMQLEWARGLVTACLDAGPSVFVKQLGTVWARENGARNRKGEDPAEWPIELRRQEMPWNRGLSAMASYGPGTDTT